MMRYFLPMIMFGLLLFFLWCSLIHPPWLLPSPLINKTLPHFSTSSLKNTRKTLTETLFYNHVSLLVVWSSWCTQCLEEHIFLTHVKKPQRLQIIGLNYRDQLASAKRWLRQYGNPYHDIIFDPQGSLGIDLGVYGVPESFLIDEKGVIRYKHIGPLTKSVWTTEIQPLVTRLMQY